MQSLDASSIKRNEGSPSTELLYIEERDKQERKELQKSLKILKILSALCEQPSLLESLLLDKEKMIQFVMVKQL